MAELCNGGIYMDYKIAVFLFAACALYIGIRALIQYFNENKRPYTLTTAKIVDFARSTNHSPTSHGTYVGYTPIFEYTYNGKTYQEEHRVSSSKYSKGMKIVPASKYKTGDTVEVRVYDNGKKIYAVIDDKNNIKMPLYAGLPLTIVGFILLAVGISFYI